MRWRGGREEGRKGGREEGRVISGGGRREESKLVICASYINMK